MEKWDVWGVSGTMVCKLFSSIPLNPLTHFLLKGGCGFLGHSVPRSGPTIARVNSREGGLSLGTWAAVRNAIGTRSALLGVTELAFPGACASLWLFL